MKAYLSASRKSFETQLLCHHFFSVAELLQRPQGRGDHRARGDGGTEGRPKEEEERRASGGECRCCGGDGVVVVVVGGGCGVRS